MKPKLVAKWRGNRLVPVAVENCGPGLQVTRNMVKGEERIVVVMNDGQLIYHDPDYNPVTRCS